MSEPLDLEEIKAWLARDRGFIIPDRDLIDALVAEVELLRAHIDATEDPKDISDRIMQDFEEIRAR